MNNLLAFLRALLVLGRVSNLPTVWSNCLAGWLLGGGGQWGTFGILILGSSCLYVGGMYLNDACDAEFDREHRPERPIPAGVIRERTVWGLCFVLLCGGAVVLANVSALTLYLGLILLVIIFLYNIYHKQFALAPVLMAACRFLLVLLSAASGMSGMDGGCIWSATAMAAYVAGLSFVARHEAQGQAVFWPAALVGFPVLLTLIVNDGPFFQRGAIFAAVVTLWLVRCFIAHHAPGARGHAVPAFLAGIILVDLASVAPVEPALVVVFPILFLLTLGLQRFVPAD